MGIGELKLIRRNKDLIIRFREKNTQFVLNWAEELEWDGDPFQERIFHPEEDFIVGYSEQRKKLNLFILREQPFCIVTGNQGMGKTQLLSWLDYELSNYESRIKTKFLRAGNSSLLNFKRRLIHPLLSRTARSISFFYFNFRCYKLKQSLEKEIFKKHVFKIFPKLYNYIFTQKYLSLSDEDVVGIFSNFKSGHHFVLLLDDAGDLSPDNVDLLFFLLNKKIPFRLIIADAQQRLKQSPWKGFKVSALHLDLKSLNNEELKELVQKRIESFNGHGIYPLDEPQLKHLIKTSDGNPKILLKLVRDAVIQLVVEKVRQKQQYGQTVSSSIPDIHLKKEGGVHIETYKPTMLPPEQQKSLSEYERKAQRSIWYLSKQFSSKPAESFYKESDVFRTPREAKSSAPQWKPTKEAQDTEKLISNLAGEFSKKRR